MAYNIELKNNRWLSDIKADNFVNIAIAVFLYQYNNNAIYRAFVDALHVSPARVSSLAQIPFLPISFFKTHRVKSGDWQHADLVFESSGTTGDIPSRHYVRDRLVYEDSLLKGFEAVYGSPTDYLIFALLPSYLERRNASLVHMARVLMEHSGHPANGLYLNEWDELKELIETNEDRGQKILLLGVTFALLDFAEACPMALKHTIVMETGGMKGRREEWTREQVHTYLMRLWQLPQVHSEYGMTELLSQAYAPQKGIFYPSATMKALVRDISDPLEVRETGTGCLNIIDLANIHSCSFIATEDIGSVSADNSFRVLGRMDHAALRGCSLMVI